MSRFLFAILFAVQVVGAPANAAGTGMRLDYAVYAGGIRLLEFSVGVGLSADGYAIGIAGGTRGWIDWLLGWRLTGRAQGTVSAEGLRPRSATTENLFRGRRRSAQLSFSPGAAVEARLEPPAEEDDRDPVPAAMTVGGTDLLTAVLSQSLKLADGACAARLPVFDGRRRFDVILTDGGAEDLAANEYSSFAGPSKKCLFRIERIAGYARRESEYDRAKDRDQLYRIWFARPLPDRPPIPVRLEGTGGMGDFVVHLVGAAATLEPPTITPLP